MDENLIGVRMKYLLRIGLSYTLLSFFVGCSILQKNNLRSPVVEKDSLKTQEADNHRIVGSSEINEDKEHHKGTYFLYGAEHLKLENNYFDIPVKYNAQVKYWIDYFTGRGRSHFIRYSKRAGRYAPVMAKILEEFKLPKDLIFLAMAESGFRNNAKSWAKAVGPWQFMPFTGRKFGLKIDWWVDERRDPIKASVAAAKYLKYLHDMFGSWELAAAGYNAGEGKVRRAIRRYRTENFWEIRKGRYLKPETKNYVPKIMALAIIGKNLKSFGFKDIAFQKTLDFEIIVVPGESDLFKISKVLEMDFEELHKWNPELMRWTTPRRVMSYHLKLPLGKKAKWDMCCSKRLADFKAVDYQFYRVRGTKSTIKDVARKFKIKGNVVAELNGMKNWNRLRRNQRVLLPFRIGQNKRAPMYADLYERPRKSVVRRRQYRKQIAIAKRKGRKISNPRSWYTVKRGDTLWGVARKNKVSLYTLIRTNLNIIGKRMIRAGDRLVVR